MNREDCLVILRDGSRRDVVRWPCAFAISKNAAYEAGLDYETAFAIEIGELAIDAPDDVDDIQWREGYLLACSMIATLAECEWVGVI